MATSQVSQMCVRCMEMAYCKWTSFEMIIYPTLAPIPTSPAGIYLPGPNDTRVDELLNLARDHRVLHVFLKRAGVLLRILQHHVA